MPAHFHLKYGFFNEMSVYRKTLINFSSRKRKDWLIWTCSSAWYSTGILPSECYKSGKKLEIQIRCGTLCHCQNFWKQLCFFCYIMVQVLCQYFWSCKYTYRYRYIHAYIHTYIQTDRQTDTQTDTQTHRQTDTQTHRQTCIPRKATLKS